MFRVAALSQIFDGVQTTAAGALRGLKDTRIPMLLSFFSFWGIGLATGYLLGFQFRVWWCWIMGRAVYWCCGICWGFSVAFSSFVVSFSLEGEMVN